MKRNSRKALPKSAISAWRKVANSITASVRLMADSRAPKAGASMAAAAATITAAK